MSVLSMCDTSVRVVEADYTFGVDKTEVVINLAKLLQRLWRRKGEVGAREAVLAQSGGGDKRKRVEGIGSKAS